MTTLTAFFAFLLSGAGHTARPVFMQYGSYNAVLCKKVPVEGQNTYQAVMGVISTKTSQNEYTF
jgi:hypothetical protein